MSRYFWLLCLVFGALNYRKALSSLTVPATGNQAHEAYSYVKRFAIGTNLPWAVMGVGYLTGYTPTGWYYLRPQDGNPFVLAWLATIVVTMLTYSYWVLFAGGAQKIVDYNLMSVLGQNNNGPHSLMVSPEVVYEK